MKHTQGKHTQGVWELVQDEKRGTRVTDSNRVNICSINGIQKSYYENAKLIAQAPELLKACKCALADLEGIMPEHEPTGERIHSAWDTIKELEAVIKKATE